MVFDVDYFKQYIYQYIMNKLVILIMSNIKCIRLTFYLILPGFKQIGIQLMLYCVKYIYVLYIIAKTT